MKKFNYLAIAISVFALAFWTTSCQEDDLATPDLSVQDLTPGKDDIQFTVLSNSAIVNGKSIREYTKDWWKYVLSFDCAHNPLIDASSPIIGQTGPIHCLVGSPSGITTKYVDVERSQTILVPVINVIRSYPSLDPSFKPAPGQSVEVFLKRESGKFINQVTEKRAFLDGKPIAITIVNRIGSGLFSVKGNKDLVNCLDCVTGKNQSAVSDGYWVAFKDLSKGQHILRVTAEVPQQGIKLDATYNLNVR